MNNDSSLLKELTRDCDDYIQYGVYLEFELWHILNFHLESFVSASFLFSGHLAKCIKNEIRLVLEGNIKASSYNGNDFDLLLSYRKKQMSATLMYLCDCIGEAKIDLELIDELFEVGDVLEILSTGKRDFNKVSKGEDLNPNLYHAWVCSTRTGPKEFFEYIKKFIARKSEKFNSEQKKLIIQAEKLLNSYYDQSPKL